MNALGEARDPFDPPRVAKAQPFWRGIARVVAIVLSIISAYTVVAGLVTFSFVGLPLGIAVSLLWIIPAAGFAGLAWRLAR
jgi:hypothetical protein